MKKKITPYRDDDQDSGFGGNYAGSIDEGGLVFDWSCYSNSMTRDSFPYHVAGPSTSRTVLRSPHSGMNTSNVRLVSECRVSSEDNLLSGSKLSDTETQRPKHADMLSSQSDLISKSSDTKHCTENVFPDKADFRGKQPANQRYSKRNIKSPSSPRSTLLQLSVNEATGKEDETRGHLRNNTQSINTKSVLRNTNSIQNKTSSHQDNTISVQDNTSSIQDNTTSVQDNTCSVQDNTASVQDNTSSIQDNTTSVQDNTCSVQDNTTSVQDNTTSVQDNTTSVQDNTSSIQDNTTSVQDNTCSVQDNTTSVQDNTSSIQDNTTSVQDNTHSIQDDINSSQENTTSVLDEQHLAGDGINKEVSLTTDRMSSLIDDI
jgi:chromosome segregation ATPase